MKSKQGLSGQISVWVERQALAALLSSSARRSTSCLTYWQIKSDVSQSAVRFPSERQLVTRLWLLSLQPGVIRRRRREGCWPPRVMMMCYWPAVNFTPFCLTEKAENAEKEPMRWHLWLKSFRLWLSCTNKAPVWRLALDRRKQNMNDDVE